MDERAFTAALAKAGAGPHVLRNASTGRVVAAHAYAALDSASRRRGLLGRDSLPDGEALIIAPTNAVHTFFMRFAIDLAFLARDGLVVATRHAVPPRRIAASFRARLVVELPAGTLEGSGTRVGHRLAIGSGTDTPADA